MIATNSGGTDLLWQVSTTDAVYIQAGTIDSVIWPTNVVFGATEFPRKSTGRPPSPARR